MPYISKIINPVFRDVAITPLTLTLSREGRGDIDASRQHRCRVNPLTLTLSREGIGGGGASREGD